MTPDTFVLTPLFAPCLMVIGHARNQHAVSDNTLEFMLADGLVKKPWPLDGKISRQLNAMESGKWLAIVARKDCEHCQKLIEEHFESPKKTTDNRRTALFIAGADQWNFLLDEVSLSAPTHGTIEWRREPFVASPAVFLIDDGVVFDAADGAESDEFLKKI